MYNYQNRKIIIPAAAIETNGTSINKGAMGIIHKSLHIRIVNFNEEDANDQVDQINIFNLRLNRVANNKSGNLGKTFCFIQRKYRRETGFYH